MRLNGSLWHCSGTEAVQSRQLVARISAAMLQRGWALTDVINISRREDDKSMHLFRQSVPTTDACFSCICLTSREHLQLINLSLGDQEVLTTLIMQNYLPGVASVDASGAEGNSVESMEQSQSPSPCLKPSCSPICNLASRSLPLQTSAQSLQGMTIARIIYWTSTLSSWSRCQWIALQCKAKLSKTSFLSMRRP